MRCAITTSLLAIATTSHAQTVGITIDVDEPVLMPGQSTTVRLVARFEADDWALGGVATSLLFDGLAGEPRDSWSGMRLLPPFDGPGTPSELTDRGIERILAGQLNFPLAGIYADPTNPIAFFEASFTAPLDAGGGYRVDLLTDTARFDVYIARDSGESQSRMDVLVEGEATISVVPAPAGAAVLALGLVAARRRR